MREDMDKQIVERPRRGSRFGALWVRRNRRRSKQQDLETAPKQVSMGVERQYDYDEQELSERLGPLLRFLHRNVGRPWEKVYSEIRARIRLDAAVQLHGVQHLFRAVSTDAIIGPMGHPMIPVSFGRGEDGVFGYVRYYSLSRYPSFYVHPVNGLLCRTPQRISNDKKPVNTLRLPRTAKSAAAVAVDDQIFVKSVECGDTRSSHRSPTT